MAAYGGGEGRQVHVEHDPWAAVFWQAALCRARYAPAARMVVTAKKNTYRRYRGPAGWLKDRLARRGLARVDHVIAASGMTAAPAVVDTRPITASEKVLFK